MTGYGLMVLVVFAINVIPFCMPATWTVLAFIAVRSQHIPRNARQNSRPSKQADQPFQQNAFEQAELILDAALDPAVASRARKGEFVKCFDHFDLLQTARN